VTLRPYLQLLRPANLVTAVADILAGYCLAVWLAGSGTSTDLVWLCLSTLGLYGGGVVLNDFFDADLDAVERPERPIPSGRVRKSDVGWFGFGLLGLGVLAALPAGGSSWQIAAVVAGLTVLYNRFAKHHVFTGPLVMGLCRGGNLLLGMSAVDEALAWGGVAAVPVAYIFAITLVSQGEVHGGGTWKLYVGLLLFVAVQSVQGAWSFWGGSALLTLPFLVLHAAFLYPPLFRAIQNSIGPNIGKAVKAGVISLILMDAAWAAATGQVWVALAIAALLPVSRFLAVKFAVT
jgi:4-hydroxybenzoate polyprenyltransferase